MIRAWCNRLREANTTMVERACMRALIKVFGMSTSGYRRFAGRVTGGRWARWTAGPFRAKREVEDSLSQRVEFRREMESGQMLELPEMATCGLRATLDLDTKCSLHHNLQPGPACDIESLARFRQLSPRAAHTASRQSRLRRQTPLRQQPRLSLADAGLEVGREQVDVLNDSRIACRYWWLR